MDQPKAPPIMRRKFQLTDLTDNANKWWMIELWADGRMKTSWGRVGATPQSKMYTAKTTYHAAKLIGEKTGKGYQEIDLVTASGQKQSNRISDPRIQGLVDMIYREAGVNRESFLKIGIDQMSANQIIRGRQILNRLVNGKASNLPQADLIRLLEEYYTVIPTKLPPRLNAAKLLNDLDPAEQEDRLDQLDAAISANTALADGDEDELSALGGVRIKCLESDSPVRQSIIEYILRTGGSGYRISNVFLVNIPNERKAFEACTVGNVTQLFHGTASHRVQSILKTGLIIPEYAANGSRFGRGIYFADQSRRSLNYTGINNAGSQRVLFIADVALGKVKKMSGDDPYLTTAPYGYDSVQGINSYSGMDEFIVYQPSQQTIRALVTLS